MFSFSSFPQSCITKIEKIMTKDSYLFLFYYICKIAELWWFLFHIFLTFMNLNLITNFRIFECHKY